MITLIWNKRVYRVDASDYYTARQLLGVPDDVATPWSSGNHLSWVRKYELDSRFALDCKPIRLTTVDNMVEFSEVEVNLYGKYPSCESTDCPHFGECANHSSAGDFRTEDGRTPDLHLTSEGWKCSQQPKQTGKGARFTDGTFANDWR